MPIIRKTHEFLAAQDWPRACFHHKLHGPEHGHSERPDRTGVPENRDCHHFYQVESGSGLNIYLMIPLSSFRLYPSARLSLSETCVKYLFVWFLLTLKLLYNIRHQCNYKNGSLLNFLFVFAFVNMSLCWTEPVLLSLRLQKFSATKYVFEPKPISFCCRKW